MNDASLQERFSPLGKCFGCGPANPEGLQLRSFASGLEVVAQWQPGARFQAFPGMLNGGIIGTLLDCHSNWTAAWFLMQQRGAEQPPCTVTANYSVTLLRPTPLDRRLSLVARVESIASDRAVIRAVLTADEKERAHCTGTFVAVRPGHPAYHQW